MKHDLASGIADSLLALLACCGAVALLYACTAPESPSLADRMPETIGEWRAVAATVEYDSESIFDYIDGHAEVYLAYGMKGCLARRYSGPEGEADIVLDLFELASPEDAYGVFTHDTDGEAAGIGNGSLLRYGWLSFWQGPHFVSIVAEGESELSTAAVLELGRAVALLLPAEGDVPAIVSALPPDGLDRRSVRFLRHPQILNTHLWVDGENVFELGPETAAALGSYSTAVGSGHLLVVDYSTPEMAEAAESGFAERFLDGVSESGAAEVADRGWFGVKRSGSRLAAVMDADSESAVRRRVAEALTPRAGAE